MRRFLRLIASLLLAFVVILPAAAQGRGKSVTVKLIDASNGEPVGFATVSLTQKGAAKPLKYALTDDQGKGVMDGVKAGAYTFKAEMMGYNPVVKDIAVKESVDLGEIKMELDSQALDAASVSAVGNPIIIKKDTIEYNASSFKTTDNDVLEDLLKKLPGVEVDESGGITVNGQTIKKITIDGKTFFLDDPSIASKNIPAKVINKLKVIEKKSDQAQFTGIDDGEEEHIIDLSVKPGMMNGMFGNVMGGAGHDVPSTNVAGDYRYQGAGFVGKFTDKSQISLILNANNTNNRGFNDLSGGMMGGMMGGGGGFGGGRGGNWGGNGITTSYMGGLNGAWTLFDDKMDIGGNYMYTNTSKDITEKSSKTTFLPEERSLLVDSDGSSHTGTYGNRIGMRLEHKFSENTSIIFQPQVNFGGGSYWQKNASETANGEGGVYSKSNSSTSDNGGANKNWSASGFGLLRQRLGKPGRTLTVMGRYSFSNNNMDGYNISNVWTGYDAVSKEWTDLTKVNQTIDQNSNTKSMFGRATYTEPLGKSFFIEANYGFRWSDSESVKNTYDEDKGHVLDVTYSNSIINRSTAHEMGANVLYQRDKGRLQLGFSANPTHTYNETTRNGQVQNYDDDRWRFSPQASAWWEFNDNTSFRMFYRGSSEQPSTSQLMPVPDNSNPLSIGFGNPSLTPYFSHSFRGDFRYNNRETFTSLNVRFNGGFVQDPIVSAVWYDAASRQYSMPFNGPASGNFGANMFANVPIAKSNFSISNMARANWSRNASYVGNNIPIEKYYDAGELDYDAFLADYAKNKDSWFTENRTSTVSATERLTMRYRSDALELALSGRTRMNHSWYTIGDATTTTWNNQVRTEANWTWEHIGLTTKGEFNYNWYRGYATAQPSEYILNLEIQKLLFKNKVTLALKGYDILGQAKNLSVTDNANYHSEVVNNTLGRYIILSLTYRFGNFGGRGMGGPGMGGPGMGGPGRMGPPRR